MIDQSATDNLVDITNRPFSHNGASKRRTKDLFDASGTIEFEGVSNNLRHLYDKSPAVNSTNTRRPDTNGGSLAPSNPFARQTTKVIQTRNSKGGGMSARGKGVIQS